MSWNDGAVDPSDLLPPPLPPPKKVEVTDLEVEEGIHVELKDPSLPCGVCCGSGFVAYITASEPNILQLWSLVPMAGVDEVDVLDGDNEFAIAEQTQPTSVAARLPFEPKTLCAFDNLIFVACNEAVLLLDVQQTAESGLSVQPLKSNTAPEDASLYSLITHSAFNKDGTLVGLTNMHTCVLFHTASMEQWVIDTVGYLASAPSLSSAEVDQETVSWIEFGQRYLFTVSRRGRLLAFSLQVDEAGSSIQVALRKDGGLIGSGKSVTALCCDDLNANLLVALSDGTVLLLSIAEAVGGGSAASTQFLAPLRTINLLTKYVAESMLLDLSSTSVHAATLSLFGSQCVALTPVGVLAIHRTNLAVGVMEAFEVVASTGATTSNGSVALVFSFSQLLFTLQLARTNRNRGTDPLAAGEEEETGENIVFAGANLLPCVSSPTAKQGTPLAAGGKSSSAAKPPAAKKGTKSVVASKPVTFGHGIRSSGYTATQPWSVQQTAKAKAKAKGKQGASKSPSLALVRYDTTCGVCNAELGRSSALLQTKVVHRGGINCIEFDAQGQHLVTGSNDSTGNVLKLPCVKYNADGYSMRGHKSQVLCADVSLPLSNPVVACGSFDGRFSLWSPMKGREEPYLFHTPASGKEVKAVRFFYQDRLLCAAAGSTIALYKYELDDGGGDLDRKRNNSICKKVSTVQTDAQCVNDMDCYNAFLSNIVVWGGSNKTVGVHDVVKGVDIRAFPEAHERAIHSVEVLRGSRYADPSSEGLHVFATAGLDSCVRLWDMRDRRGSAVRAFTSHSNTGCKVGLALSPCGRFLAVGSESRSCYLYDRGSGVVIDKLSMGDTVSAVRYHPSQAILAVGANNGQLKFFGEPKSNKE